jgi:nucleoside-diphosphate-sugar epimerase
MRILVTGGTGVVGTATVRSLLAAGHRVRLLSRHAPEEATRWQGEVEPLAGDVAISADVAGAAADCEAVLHIAGIVEERPPEATFTAVNVAGTRHLVAEAERAGVGRFVLVSSLGADTGSSAYHASKRQSEEIVRTFSGDWRICRPGNVYGPGDEVISFLLQIVRGSPVAPLVGLGDQSFQPIWADDLGVALALAVERPDLAGRVLLLAGPEVTTPLDLVGRLARLTGRDPVSIPVPPLLASIGAQAASLLGVRVPFDSNKRAMLEESNVIPEGEPNALTEVLGVRATPLDRGLAELASRQPEQLEGTGPLVRRRFTARLGGVTRTAKELFRELRKRFFELAPEATLQPAGEAVGEQRLARGATLTLALPLRGHVQVRVVEIAATSLTLVTLAGHPLAGAVTFRFFGTPEDRLQFEVETCDRSATSLDDLALRTVGLYLKRWTWSTFVERTAVAFGCLPPIEVVTEEETLTGEVERRTERAIERKVSRLARWEERKRLDDARASLAEAAARQPA